MNGIRKKPSDFEDTMKTYLQYLKANPKQKKTSYNNFRIKVKRPKKVHLYNTPAPVFENNLPDSTFHHPLKLERFANIAERLGVNYLIVYCVRGHWFTIEAQEINLEPKAFNKIKNSGFVDVEGGGSYMHGFHYFADKEKAEYIKRFMVNYGFESKVIPVLVGRSNSRGYLKSVECHVTDLFQIF